MASINTKKTPTVFTHPGSPAKNISKLKELKRTVSCCFLWENSFYEDGVSISKRIKDLVHENRPEDVEALAIICRNEKYLRHVPLFLCVELARLNRLRAKTLCDCIQRADELSEFLALYWKDGKCPLSSQVKKGLAQAFTKFNEYGLAKYNRHKEIMLRDVLFLCHAKPKDKEQEIVFKKLVEGKLETPDTWEVNLSGGKDKKETWERLLKENKLGGLALLRNLRNMENANVDSYLIKNAINSNDFKMVLPFRFISAAKAAPKYEDCLDEALLKMCNNQKKIRGKTVLVVDVSGSMYGVKVSSKSDMDRALAACSLAAIAREIFEDISIYATAGSDYSRIHQTKLVPARRGMALIDAIYSMCSPLGGGGIFLTPVCNWLREREEDVERMIVVTDEQDCAGTGKDSPQHANPLGKINYMLNVSTDRNGIGYGKKWVNVSGWSEQSIRFMKEYEEYMN